MIADSELAALIPPLVSAAVAAINGTTTIKTWIDHYLAHIPHDRWVTQFSENEPRVWGGFCSTVEAPSEVCLIPF